jgi:hypothetical protein
MAVAVMGEETKGLVSLCASMWCSTSALPRGGSCSNGNWQVVGAVSEDVNM